VRVIAANWRNRKRRAKSRAAMIEEALKRWVPQALRASRNMFRMIGLGWNGNQEIFPGTHRNSPMSLELPWPPPGTRKRRNCNRRSGLTVRVAGQFEGGGDDPRRARSPARRSLRYCEWLPSEPNRGSANRSRCVPLAIHFVPSRTTCDASATRESRRVGDFCFVFANPWPKRTDRKPGRVTRAKNSICRVCFN